MKREFQINVGVDFNSGRGFGPIGAGLPESLLEGEPKDVLSTIAVLFLNPDPKLSNSYSQAVSYLALYAARTNIALTTQQFRQLERRVRRYRSFLVLDGHERNRQYVNYVLKHAVARAKEHKII